MFHWIIMKIYFFENFIKKPCEAKAIYNPWFWPILIKRWISIKL